jgi:hypothetical protein
MSLKGREEIRMMEAINSTMKYCKNFVNVTMYPQHSNNIILK